MLAHYFLSSQQTALIAMLVAQVISIVSLHYNREKVCRRDGCSVRSGSSKGYVSDELPTNYIKLGLSWVSSKVEENDTGPVE